MNFVKKAFTHGGVFHADDVFSAALLKIIFPGILIERGNLVPEDYDGIVFDIGCGKFDHHMKNSPVRDNGVPYASFGLLWREFGPRILPEDVVADFDESFVQMIDETDNTGKPNPISRAIKDFNPMYGEVKDYDQRFEKAVNGAKAILERKFEILLCQKEEEKIARRVLENADKNYIILDEHMTISSDLLKEYKVDYLISPSDRGGYSVVARAGKYFPEEWRGASADELRKMTGIDDIRFCHQTGYLCAVDEVESAIRLVENIK